MMRSLYSGARSARWDGGGAGWRRKLSITVLLPATVKFDAFCTVIPDNLSSNLYFKSVVKRLMVRIILAFQLEISLAFLHDYDRWKMRLLEISSDANWHKSVFYSINTNMIKQIGFIFAKGYLALVKKTVDDCCACIKLQCIALHVYIWV